MQSRNGSDLTPAFPDLAAAARDLPEAMVLGGECVVVSDSRLDFSALQARARRRGVGARAAAVEHPAHLVVFDVLELAGRSLLAEPYRSRRETLVGLFEHGVLADRFSLCPATTDRDTALAWLDPAWGGSVSKE
ncbi:hypothetical protein ACFV1B_26815 [Streptomyces sp. NPDC059637]|uniref:ATP-dependent DNA ligase n=1 Tax=Streptomyces sp. NPDC059637 TaxID=3347752 RepID=UPI0036A3BC45